MKKLRLSLFGLLALLWLSNGAHAETIHKSIHDLPDIVYMDNETIPEGFEDYLYYPFQLAATPEFQKNNQPWNGGSFAAWDIISYLNPEGDQVKLIATENGYLDYNGPGNKLVPYELRGGAVKWLVNDQSQFKGYMTFADIDNGERVKVKKNDIYKIAIPKDSDLKVEISEDGEEYRFYTEGSYRVEDPRAFFTFFFNNLSSNSIAFRGGRSIDFSTRTTWKEPEKTGTAIIRYLDENGNDFPWSRTILTWAIGSEFSISEKTFDNYDLNTKPSSPNGIFENIKPLEFVFTYSRTQGTITINYLTHKDNKEQKISDPLVINGNVGDQTTLKAKDIEGYKLVENQSEEIEKTFSKEPQTFNFFYELKKPIKIDNIPNQTIKKWRNISPIKISTDWDIQDIIVWEVKNGNFIPALPERLSYDKTTNTITGLALAPVGEYKIRVIAKSPHSTNDLNYDVSTEFKLTITRRTYHPDNSWISTTPINKPSQETNDKKEKKSEPKEEITAKKEDITTPTTGEITYKNEEIFNTTILDGKCYTRRPLQNILDSLTLKTSEEFKKSQSFLRSYEMTRYNSIDQFRPKDDLTREEAAKIFSNFAINVLCRKPDTNLSIHYSDVENADPTLKPYITLAYQLGVMKGSWMGDGEFRPFDKITKAEVNAVLIRMILKSYLDEKKTETKTRYSEYEKVARELWIIKNNLNNDSLLREYTALMLFRAYKNQVFEWRNIDYFSYVLQSRDLFVK